MKYSWKLMGLRISFKYLTAFRVPRACMERSVQPLKDIPSPDHQTGHADVAGCSTFSTPSPDPSVMWALCEAALTCEDNRAQSVYLPILVPHWRMPGPYAQLTESFLSPTQEACWRSLCSALTVLFPILLVADSSSGCWTPTLPPPHLVYPHGQKMYTWAIVEELCNFCGLQVATQPL